MRRVVACAEKLRGSVKMPSDKSISCRGAIINALACGEALIENYLLGEDTLNALGALRDVGVEWELTGENLRLVGKGGSHFSEAQRPLHLGTSAGSLRFLAGLLAPEAMLTVLSGAPRTNRRPMERIVSPLQEMGARITGRSGGRFAPLVLRGGSLHGIDYTLPIASSEVKTCLLLAALRAKGASRFRSPYPTRDHTERMLRAMGARIETPESNETVVYPLDRPLAPSSFRVPGEIGVAVYWLVCGSVHPDADILIEDVCLNPLRTGILDALEAMGADVRVENERTEAWETIGDLRVRSSPLIGIEVPPELIPRMVDEIPGFILAASLARGKTRISGASDLRAKKTDRLAHSAQEFRKLGARIEETSDGLVIEGVEELVGSTCSSHGDHRLGNSLAVAGLVARGETTLLDAGPISEISYPGFWSDLDRISENAV